MNCPQCDSEDIEEDPFVNRGEHGEDYFTAECKDCGANLIVRMKVELMEGSELVESD